jgi:CRP/FNR family cyclic AMP-dependent transcriptional regulator
VKPIKLVAGKPANQWLADNRLFHGLPERIIDKLALAAMSREYDKAERIFSQGDEGDSLYCIVTGRVRLDAVAPNGREVFLNYMYPGDCFGEIAVVDGLPRTAGAGATETTVLLGVHRREFRQLLNDESKLAIHLLQLFCERMRWTTNLFEDSALLEPSARLAKRVLSLAMLHGRRSDGGLELSISQSDLALFLGISRQVVNYHLHDWRRQGWIDVSRARLVVRDPDALRRLGMGSRNEYEIVD